MLNVEYLNQRADIADKVAAGLRHMDKKPDAFLFFDNGNFFYDKDEFLSIPVYRTSFIYQSNGQNELIFYPIFIDPHFDSVLDVSRFRRAYEDH